MGKRWTYEIGREMKARMRWRVSCFHMVLKAGHVVSTHLRWLEGIVGRELDAQLEAVALIGGLLGARDGSRPEVQVAARGWARRQTRGHLRILTCL